MYSDVNLKMRIPNNKIMPFYYLQYMTCCHYELKKENFLLISFYLFFLRNILLPQMGKSFPILLTNSFLTIKFYSTFDQTLLKKVLV